MNILDKFLCDSEHPTMHIAFGLLLRTAAYANVGLLHEAEGDTVVSWTRSMHSRLQTVKATHLRLQKGQS